MGRLTLVMNIINVFANSILMTYVVGLQDPLEATQILRNPALESLYLSSAIHQWSWAEHVPTYLTTSNLQNLYYIKSSVNGTN